MTRTITLTRGPTPSSLNTMTTVMARPRVAVGGAAAPRTLTTMLPSPTAATRLRRTSMMRVDRLPAESTHRRNQVTEVPRISRRGKTSMVSEICLDIHLERRPD